MVNLRQKSGSPLPSPSISSSSSPFLSRFRSAITDLHMHRNESGRCEWTDESPTFTHPGRLSMAAARGMPAVQPYRANPENREDCSACSAVPDLKAFRCKHSRVFRGVDHPIFPY